VVKKFRGMEQYDWLQNEFYKLDKVYTMAKISPVENLKHGWEIITIIINF
jgi:hypothetical protein